MARFQFTSVVNAFVDDFTKIAKSADTSVTKAHDAKVYAALIKPFKEVKDFYTAYEKLLLEAKKQCKSNIDAMENTLKVSAGKPTAVQLKLMAQSKALIAGADAALKEHATLVKNELMDWRGPWTQTAEGVLFKHDMLNTMRAYRKTVIDNQTSVWNPINERVTQYALRADMLLKSIEKAANSGKLSAEQAIQEAQAAHATCMGAGTKGVLTLAAAVDGNLHTLAAEAKKGIAKDADVKKVWESKKGQLEQFAAYRKSFKGAEKTLDMLFQSVELEIKSAQPPALQTWRDLRTDLQKSIKAVAVALKQHTEAMKSVDTITKQYEEAIKKAK